MKQFCKNIRNFFPSITFWAVNERKTSVTRDVPDNVTGRHSFAKKYWFFIAASNQDRNGVVPLAVKIARSLIP